MRTDLNRKREFAFLGIIVLIACLILYFPFISGEKVYIFYGDANDDTFQSYLPMYQAIIEKIRDLDFSLLDFTWCAGESLLGAQFVVFDPFAIPIYLIGALLGTTVVPKLLVWIQILRVLCAAAACDYFLNCFKLNCKSRMIASICYAFSAFMIGGIGQHYMFATAPVIFALMLAFLEKSSQESKCRIALTLCVAVAGIWSVYFCYMMLLSCGIYAVLRFWTKADKISWKAILNWFGPLLLCVITGLMLSAIVFLPSAYIMMFSSDRMSERSSLGEMFTLKTVQQLKTGYLRLFAEQAEGTMNSWTGYQTHFNSPHLYISAMLIAAVPQYLFAAPKMGRKERQVSVVVAFAGVIAFFFPVVGVAYNAFTYYMARYVFVLLPVFAFVIAKVLTEAENRQYFSCLGAAVSIAATIFAAVLCNWASIENTPDIRGAIIFNFAAVFMSVLCLYLLSRRQIKWKVQAASTGMLIVFVAVILESWVGLHINRNSILEESMDWIYSKNGIQWMQQIREQNDSQIYRTERVLTGWGDWPMFSSSLVFNYSGVTGYNSVLNDAMIAFCDVFTKDISWDGVSTTVTYTYGELGRPWDWCMADLLGIRYILSSYPVAEPEWELVYESYDYGTELMYQNPRIQTIGTVYYGWYPETQVSEDTLENQMMLPFAVSLDHAAENVLQVNQPEIRYEQITVDPLVVAAQSSADNCVVLPLDSFEHQENERTWLSFKVKGTVGTNLVCAVDTGFGFSSVNWSNGTYVLNEEEMTVFLALPNDIQQVGFYVDGAIREDVIVSDLVRVTTTGKNYTTEGIEIHSPQQSGELYGTVQMDKAGILVLPVFIQDGWHLEVDGEEREIWLANTALCATELSEGIHSIRMWYEAPWGNAGLAVSALGLACLLGMVYVEKRRKQ